MNELKPCPFCGSDHYQHEGNSDGGELWFSCQNCGAYSPVSTNTDGDDYSETVAKWNTRPLEDALRAEIATLKSENERLKSSINFKDDALTTYSEFYERCCEKLGYEDVNPSTEMDEIILSKLSEVSNERI